VIGYRWRAQFGRGPFECLLEQAKGMLTGEAGDIGLPTRTRAAAGPWQVTLAWTLAQPGVTSTLLGARSPEQLLASMQALTVELSPEQLADLNQVSAIELGFPHDFLTQVRASALDGGVVITDAPKKAR
jgi:hypothetical protein